MLKINRSISLVGMPGAGKTSIGKELAKLTNIQLFDADNEIEISAGRNITDIFTDFGEDEFRKGEYKVIKRILSNSPCLLSTGGGAFINKQTHKEIKQNSISVFIDVELNSLWSRLKEKKHRPLINGKNAKKDLENIFNQRYDIYKKADIIIKHNDSKTQKIIAKEIIEELKKYDG